MHIRALATARWTRVEGDAGNTLQGFAVGLGVAELQLRLPDVYKGEGKRETLLVGSGYHNMPGASRGWTSPVV